MIAQRLLRAAIASWLAKGVTLAVRFLLTPFILHRLGDAHYGLLALVGSVAAQGTLLDLGIGPALTKFIAEYRARGQTEQARRIISTALVLYSGLGLVALVLCSGFAPIFPDLFQVAASDRAIASAVVVLTGVQLAVSIPGTTAGAVLRGLHRYDMANAVSTLGTLVLAGATVLVLLAGGGIIGLVALNIPVTLGVQGLSVWCVNRSAPELRFTWRGARRDLVKSVLSFSASTFMLEMAYTLQTKLDEVVIALFLPLSFVSPYFIARRLSGIPMTIAEQCIVGLVPIASELESVGNASRLRALYLVGSRITMAVSVSFGGVLIALAPPFLTVWVGPEYAAYAPIVTVLTLAGILEITLWPAGAILQGMARHHRLAVAAVVGGVANLGLSILLVRYYGILGVAMGTLIPIAALSFGYVWPYAARTIGTTASELVRQVFLPGLLPAVPMLMVVYGLVRTSNPATFVSVGLIGMVGLATYGITYFAFGAGDVERQLVRGLISRFRSMIQARAT